MKLACVILKLGALIAISTMLTGCATPGGQPPVAGGEAREHAAGDEGGQRKQTGLWTKQLYRSAKQPRLVLTFPSDARDVLVSYDECHGKSTKVRRRAYWLFACNAVADAHAKPKFTNAAACRQLNPIPLVEVAEANAAPAKGYAAFADANSRSFRLWRDGQDLGVFELPVYVAVPPATFWRVGVTAVAVAAVVFVAAACLAGQAPN
jgi:hypothetical protein